MKEGKVRTRKASRKKGMFTHGTAVLGGDHVILGTSYFGSCVLAGDDDLRILPKKKKNETGGTGAASDHPGPRRVMFKDPQKGGQGWKVMGES